MRTSNRIDSGRAGVSGDWRFLLAFAAMVVFTEGQAMAVTTVWTGSPSGGVFNDDANWSMGAPGHTSPGTDLGIFNNATNVDGTITFDADISHYRAFVQNDAGTISFDTGSHKWTLSDFLLVGAADAPGFPKVRHIGGEIQFGFVLLGTEEFGPNPSFELTGSNTHLHTTRGSGGYQIGLQSDGATMLVHNGASMTADGQVIIGLVGSSNSKLTIDGVGSELVAGNYLGVGHTGDTFTGDATGNRAEIINGASATASHVFMAITPGAPDNTLLVSGAGTTLALTGVGGNDGTTTAIGRQGSNNLFQIDSGAAVGGNNRIVLGLETTSTNNQIVINDGSLAGTSLEINRGNVTVTNGTIDLIQYFNETMMIYEGGGIVATNGASSTFTFNSGTVRSVNANINNGSAFTVGDGGGTSATYHMRRDIAGNRGTHTFAGGLSLASNGILSGDGDIVGNVSGAAGAQAIVGASPGVINVTGAWDNTGINIALELDDLSASLVPGEAFDQLNITGAFTHGGSVTIDVSELVGPGSEEQLKLIGWGSQAGMSSSTSVAFVGGSPLTHSFLADGLYLTVPGGGLAGDYNGDGSVDAADYVVWRKTDGTQDGYNTWRANFGQTAGTGSAVSSGTAAVPEPAAWVVCLGLATIGICIGSRPLSRRRTG
ncbi:MAG: hypothetical protein WD738_22445 [Pirellulales bacterium]